MKANVLQDFLICISVPLTLKQIWDALHDLVPFVLLKKLWKHPLKRVTFSKVERFFSCFLKRTNGTKSRNALQCSDITDSYH